MPFNQRSDGTLIQARQQRPMNRASFKRTSDGAELMNVDGRAAGAASVLWNGTGAGDTGGDWTISTVGTSTGAEAAAAKKSGTNGWNTTVTTQNDMTVLDNGSMLDVDGSYSALEFWMQPKAYPFGSNLRLRWVDSANALVGNQVNVSGYVQDFDVDVWQRVSVPIEDFGLTGNVQKLQIRYRAAGGQHFWFDDFDLINAAGGGPYRYQIKAPDADTLYHVTMAVLMIAAPASGWNRGAFADISSGLDRGLIFRHRKISTSEVLWLFATKTNMALFGQFHPQEDVTFADGELMMGFMAKPGDDATILVTNDEVLEFVVRDDLSSIAEIRGYCHYGVEVIS